MKRYFVYILANHKNGTLYVGSITNLIQRICQHKNNVFPGFTAQYQIYRLVYYGEHINVIEMVRREKRFKNWGRKWKLNLINEHNPNWRDLYDEICG